METETKKPKVKKIKEEKIVETPTEKTENKVETKTEAPKTEEKKETKKVEVKKIVKEVAVANAYSIPVSTKNCVAICRLIRTKSPERAIEMMKLVLKKKMAVPMVADEIPHRKRSLMPEKFGGGGRFPENAAKEFVGLLGQLKANCDVNGVENPVITIAMANLASRPFRREGRRTKRTHVHLEAKSREAILYSQAKARDKTKLMVAPLGVPALKGAKK